MKPLIHGITKFKVLKMGYAAIAFGLYNFAIFIIILDKHVEMEFVLAGYKICQNN